MNRTYVKELLAVAVIILFIGVAFAPSINANVIEENEIVEITTEICRIGDFGPHNVKLKKQEMEELNTLINNIKNRLDRVETKDEAVDIFNEAIVKLNEYGLFPRGMSVEEIQALVTGNYNRLDNNNLVERVYEQNEQPLDDNENRNCLIAGHTRFSLFASLSSIPRLILLFLLSQIRIYRFNLIFYLIEKIHDLTNYSFPLLSFIYEKLHINIFALNLGLSLFLGIALPFLLPVDIGGIITFGHSFYYDPWYGYTYTPSKGWVFTSGQNGIIKWDDTFYGHLGGDILCVGAKGYTGLKSGYHSIHSFWALLQR